MSWILEYFVVYLLCVYMCSAGYVDATYCSVVSTLMLGVSHIVGQNIEQQHVHSLHLTRTF